MPTPREKLHISWRIMWGCIGFIAGIASVVYTHMTLDVLPVLVIAVTLVGASIRARPIMAATLWCVAGVIIGMWHGGGMHQAQRAIGPFVGQRVVIQGVIADDPTITSSGAQRITLKNNVVSDVARSGSIWVETSAHTQLKRSDSVQFEGVLSEGFGTISASMFRAKLVYTERTKHADPGLELRDWFASAVRNNITDPEASLGVGYLVGQRSTLPEDLDEKLQLLGLTHIVVASGYNLTILVRFARKLFVRHSKYLATFAGFSMISSFVLITGFSPSMSRAALVTGLGLLAWYYGRRVHPFVLLPFAAAITLVFNPTYIWGDIAWYLSFLSFAGILILAPLIRTYFFGETEPPAMLGIFLETMSAQIATLPLILFVFGQYSLLALPANMLILPLVPLAMACTFIAGLGSLILPGLAMYIVLPAQSILAYMTGMIDWLGDVPGAGGAIEAGSGLLIGGYVALVIVTVWLLRKTKYTFKNEQDIV